MAVTKVFTRSAILETNAVSNCFAHPPFQSPSFNVGDDRLIFKMGQGMGLAVHTTLKLGVKGGIVGICQQRILGKTFVTALCIFQGLSPYKSPSNGGELSPLARPLNMPKYKPLTFILP